jgi:AcrR family transcriptional regulator
MARPASRSRLPAGERRAVILEAALQLFAERGYDGASVSDIADAAGITKAVVYDHFASKRDIHIELIRAETDRILTRSAQAFAAADGEYERLRAVTDVYFKNARERPFTRLFLAPAPAGDPEIGAAQLEAERRATLTLAALIMEMRPHADPPRAEMAAAMCRGALNALGAWWDEHPRVPRRQVVDLAVELLWNGLPAVPETAPRHR